MLIREIIAGYEVRIISICRNINDKWQFINLTKNKICPCEFNSEQEAFNDLYNYIKSGRIKSIEIIKE